jgi:hypothetical protein
LHVEGADTRLHVRKTSDKNAGKRNPNPLKWTPASSLISNNDDNDDGDDDDALIINAYLSQYAKFKSPPSIGVEM